MLLLIVILSKFQNLSENFFADLFQVFTLQKLVPQKLMPAKINALKVDILNILKLCSQ